MSLTTGQVAKRAGIGVPTVRFYERKGLIKEPLRTESGYRQYPEDVVARLRFIKRAKKLGFTLKEILELLSACVEYSNTACPDVKRRVELKITDIEGEIRTFRRMKKSLVKLAAACNGDGPTDECPICDTLNKESG